jgi:[ribosomal protein S5]-alanine N-acetyltransferase
MPILFETERLRVRHYTKDDSHEFFLLNGDEEIMRYIRPVKTKEECDEYLAEIIRMYEQSPLAGRWAAVDKQTNEFIGSFAFIPIGITDEMQLGYSLLRQNWGKGYATELTLAGLDYVFTKTSLTEVFGVTEAANVASQKVLLKAGFTYESTYPEGEKELFRYRFLKSDFINKKY